MSYDDTRAADGRPNAAATPANRPRSAWQRVGIPIGIVLALIAGLWTIHYLTVPHPATHVIATIAVGQHPYPPVSAPDGSVYVLNSGDRTVSVIRGTQVIATVPVGGNPLPPAVTPDGIVYVPNASDATVSIVKGTQVVATIDVGNQPATPGVAPDGTVYVPNVYDKTLSVIKDTQVVATLDTLCVPTTPVAASGRSVYVYVPCLYESSVWVIGGAEAVDLYFDGRSPGQPAIASDGTVYTPYVDSNFVSVRRNAKTVSVIPVGKSPRGAVTTPDNTVYVPNYDDGTLSAIKDLGVVATLAISKRPFLLPVGGLPAVASDGTVYAVGRDDPTPNGIVTVIKDAAILSTITVGRDPLTPAVAPNGTVYVPNYGDGTVSVLR